MTDPDRRAQDVGPVLKRKAGKRKAFAQLMERRPIPAPERSRGVRRGTRAFPAGGAAAE